MIDARITARMGCALHVEAAPGLNLIDPDALYREGELFEGLLYNTLPPTTYVALAKHIEKRLLGLQADTMTQQLSHMYPDRIAAVLHHADGTQEVTVMHSDKTGYDDEEVEVDEDGKPINPDSASGMISASEMGIIHEDDLPGDGE